MGRRPRLRSPFASMLYATGAVLALLLFGYLFVALLTPERFS